jgi:hypothetical protein
MNTPGPWIAIILGISAIAAIVLAAVALLRARASVIPLSPEGKDEFARLPMTPLQKTAWMGFAGGLALGGGILLIFFSNGGAQGYDKDPGMRMQILGLFLASILNFTVFSALARKLADERDKAVLAWAPHTQAISIVLLVAAWCTVLPIRFHDEGAAPTIFCYLLSGSVWLVYMFSFFIGILLGGWVSPRHAQS